MDFRQEEIQKLVPRYNVSILTRNMCTCIGKAGQSHNEYSH